MYWVVLMRACIIPARSCSLSIFVLDTFQPLACGLEFFFGLTMEVAQLELFDKWSDMKVFGHDVKLFPNPLITHESFDEWSEVKQVSTGFTSILLRHPFCVQA